MKSVFVLQHSYSLDGCDETKFIGVYETNEKAQLAIERLKLQPGFKELPEKFNIDEYELDKDHWTEGFATVTNIQVRKGSEWITATVRVLPNGYYQLVENYYDDETGQEFKSNDVVRCEEKKDEEGTGLYAVELIKKGKV